MSRPRPRPGRPPVLGRAHPASAGGLSPTKRRCRRGARPRACRVQARGVAMRLCLSVLPVIGTLAVSTLYGAAMPAHAMDSAPQRAADGTTVDPKNTAIREHINGEPYTLQQLPLPAPD